MSRSAWPRRLADLAAIAAIAAGLWLAIQGAWIPAKGWLAQLLIARAWDERRATLAAGAMTDPGFGRPWPWADIVPIARLRFERLGEDRIVLAGDSGAVLAFGPGHRSASPLPGEPGNAVISGHRDTHFALLRRLRAGDTIAVERAGPATADPASGLVYRVTGNRLIRADDGLAVADVLGNDPAGDGDDGGRLTLVTCWPFDAIDPGTPWRYVVTAEQIDGPDRTERGAGRRARSDEGPATDQRAARSATWRRISS